VRAASKRLLLALTLLLVTGCQTDERGLGVNATAALRAYREHLDRKPTRAQTERIVAALSPEQLNDMGVLYEREGRLDKAEWAYQHAIWRDPRFAPAYVNLGNVLRNQGKSEEALFRYRQALNADPRSFEAANNFGDLCAEQRVHVQEAIAHLAPLTAQPGPHRAYGLDTLGWLYHVRGDDAKAAAVLESALREASPEQAALLIAIHEHLAGVCSALGRGRDAAAHRAKAQALKQHSASAPGPQPVGRPAEAIPDKPG